MSYLYVICTPSGVRKVGYARDPYSRCIGVSSQLGMRCALEYEAEIRDDMVRVAEKHAHALLWEKRTDGEYFDVDAGTARRAVDDAAYRVLMGNGFKVPPRPEPPAQERVNFVIDPDLRRQIKRWRHANQIDTEGEAVRILLRRALETHGIKLD